MGKEIKMTQNKRKAIFVHLEGHDIFAKQGDFIEVTEWTNGEGVDINIEGRHSEKMKITWGEWEVLKKIMKKFW